MRVQEIAPVLPTRDVRRSLAHYAAIRFETSAYRPDEVGPLEYGYLTWDAVSLHLCRFDKHDPLTTASQVYLYVEDADALYRQWRSAGVEGRFTEPVDADHGLREAAHVDPEGNLLRYGSWLPGFGPG